MADIQSPKTHGAWLHITLDFRALFQCRVASGLERRIVDMGDLAA